MGWVVLAFLGFIWLLFAAQGVYHWISLSLECIVDVQTAAFWLGLLFLTAVLMFLSMLWYWAALRWVRQHDQRS